MDHTKVLKLADELDNRFGNKYAPKHYKCVQKAVTYLRDLVEENKILTDKELNDTTTR